jgi:hypothetical protein
MGPVCGKVVQLCIEGVVVGGMLAYEWVMRPDEVEQECKECANTNDAPPPPEDCPVRHAKLLTLFEVLVYAASNGGISPSAKANYIRDAKAYNASCVPKGYPALPTNFMR